MEARFSSESSVYFKRITRCYTPEDRNLGSHCCENLKSNKLGNVRIAKKFQNGQSHFCIIISKAARLNENMFYV
jgi:hypothetical protein